MIVRFYNLVAQAEAETTDDIPDESLNALYCLTYLDHCRPFIVQDVKKGLSQDFIANRYKVSRSSVRVIMRDHQIG